MLTLFGWVFNMFDVPFPIDIGKSMTVGHLKDAIKKKEPTFGDVDADTLRLWNVGKLPCVGSMTSDFQEVIFTHSFCGH